MSSHKKDGSINIYSTQLGLNKVFKHNFLEQSYLPSAEKDASLKHLKFKNKLTDDNTVLMSRKALQTIKLFTVADLKTPETTINPV